MKFITLFTIIAMMTFSSCVYDRRNIPTITNNGPTPIDCTNDTVHYSTDLQPIITGSCAIAGCHLGHGQGGVNALDYTNISNVQAEDSAIYARLTYPVTKIDTPAFMPKNNPPLTAAQIKSFYCWWKQGAPNN